MERPHFVFNPHLPPYKFGSRIGFFLVAGNSALITLRPSGSCGLQVQVQPFTLSFHSYVHFVRARASDVPHFYFSLPLFKGHRSFGVQF